MLCLLTATTDKIQLVTSAAVTVDVHASFMDMSQADPPVVKGSTSGRQHTAISTAATTDIVAAPAASTTRGLKALYVRNKHATSSVDVTVVFDQNGTDFELHKATLLAGEMLEYIEGLGFFTVQTARKAFFNRRVTTDSVHATAATFADVTGLTCPVQSGKHYNFEAHLYHIENAATTGAQFAINGPAMTAMQLQEIGAVIPSVTASSMQSNVAAVTARDTAAVVATASATTPGVVLAILSGWINPSADGTFAIRATSEVTVAAGLTIRAGSWMQLWESDN